MNQNQQQSINLPGELRAVLHIFTNDDELKRKALPHVNVEHQSINWSGICRNHFGSGHFAAVLWAQAIWFDKIETKFDPFDQAFAMATKDHTRSNGDPMEYQNLAFLKIPRSLISRTLRRSSIFVLISSL